MQEGMLSLMQMPRATIMQSTCCAKPGLPYVVVLTDPTFGGVSASYAMLGDIQIAEPGAQIGFAGARVIAQTIREEIARRFPARRISAGPRHAGHGGAPRRNARYPVAPGCIC